MLHHEGKLVWFGEPDEGTLEQMNRCMADECVAAGVLCADGHRGYSQPIGGVVAYRNSISPSGVGYDIACGIMAVKTDLLVKDIDVSNTLSEIVKRISFGVGRVNETPIDHELFDSMLWSDETNTIGKLKDRAYKQLGTVGSGNHFVDLLTDDNGSLWVAAHFGSRGFGHGVASGFLNLAAGRKFFDKAPGESIDAPPTLLPIDSYLGQTYIDAMTLAGRYAYAGREYVIQTVLGILDASPMHVVHNHHNYAWKEIHSGEPVFVVRKGATPAFPGQEGFVGGSMADIAAVVEGIGTEENMLALRSTVHGAGRIMSRTAAKGRTKKGVVKVKGAVTRQMMSERTDAFGVIVRGGDVDESPHVYRPLKDVLEEHKGTIKINHILRPVGVVMAGADIKDPYKD